MQLEQHIESFRHMLQDSEIRKFRATQKSVSESKEVSQRVQEIKMLSRDLDRAIARFTLLKTSLHVKVRTSYKLHTSTLQTIQ